MCRRPRPGVSRPSDIPPGTWSASAGLGEDFRPMIEVGGCLEHGEGDPTRLLRRRVTGETRGDEAVVVRPHGAVVVAERVERRLPGGQCAHPQPLNSRSPMMWSTTASTLESSTIPLHSSWPMFEARVGTCLPSPSTPERRSRRSEIEIEPGLEARPRRVPAGRPWRRRAIPREPAGRYGSAHRTRSPAARRWRAVSSPVHHRGTRWSPRSPSSTGSPTTVKVAALVLQIAVAVQVAVVFQPVQRRSRLRPTRPRDRCRLTSVRTHQGRSRTAVWSPRTRSTATAAVTV